MPRSILCPSAPVSTSRALTDARFSNRAKPVTSKVASSSTPRPLPGLNIVQFHSENGRLTNRTRLKKPGIGARISEREAFSSHPWRRPSIRQQATHRSSDSPALTRQRPLPSPSPVANILESSTSPNAPVTSWPPTFNERHKLPYVYRTGSSKESSTMPRSLLTSLSIRTASTTPRSPPLQQNS